MEIRNDIVNLWWKDHKTDSSKSSFYHFDHACFCVFVDKQETKYCLTS